MATSTTPSTKTVLTVEQAREIARHFQILSDPTRVRIIKALADQEWSVSELVKALEMDQPAVSHQLRFLRENNLVQWRKKGRRVYYQLEDTPLREALDSSLTLIP